jgi:hypothetical protein
MRALFGAVSLLVVLAIVGLVAMKQLKAVGVVEDPALTAAGLPSPTSASGTPRERARNLEKKVADDVAKSLSDAAAARQSEADKP